MNKIGLRCEGMSDNEEHNDDQQQIVIPHTATEGVVDELKLGEFTVGDYVTRDGTDIHYVESHDSDMVEVVCIVAPSDDWARPGELENNLTCRYSRINKHFLPFAKSEHKKLKALYPAGWVDEV